MNFKKIAKELIIGSGALKLIHKYKGTPVTILRYHSVQDDPEAYEPTIGSSIIHSTDNFRQQMEMLSRYYNLISMDDVLMHLEEGVELPPLSVAVTFDDGYKDNLEKAAPILDEFNIPATFYIITESIADQGNATAWFMRVRKAFSDTKESTWTDSAGNVYSLSDNESRIKARKAAMSFCGSSNGKKQLEYVEDMERLLKVSAYESGLELMLTWDDIRELKSFGHIIGSHTLSHPNLTYVDVDEAEFEMRQSKVKLESELGEVVRHFAYPNPILTPNWNKSTCAISKKIGYKTAVTCDEGRVKLGDDPLSLKRVFVPQHNYQLRWHIESTMNKY